MIPVNHEVCSVVRDFSKRGPVRFMLVTATSSGSHILHTPLMSRTLEEATEEGIDLAQAAGLEVPPLALIEDDDYPRAITVDLEEILEGKGYFSGEEDQATGA